jgi:hypothetical protein
MIQPCKGCVESVLRGRNKDLVPLPQLNVAAQTRRQDHREGAAHSVHPVGSRGSHSAGGSIGGAEVPEILFDI